MGLRNYDDALFRNADFWHVARNSAVFALSGSFPGVVVFRTIFFAPVVTSAAAWAIVWKFQLQGDAGFINQMLAVIGIAGPNWLREPDWAMAAVIVIRVIKMVGLNMILYFATLQAIPRDYEAAARSRARPACRSSAGSSGRCWARPRW